MRKNSLLDYFAWRKFTTESFLLSKLKSLHLKDEIAMRFSVFKKHTTAYDNEIEDLGRIDFLGDGLNIIDQRIRPYQFYQKG